jgi:GT2 family glycosyltransferase
VISVVVCSIDPAKLAAVEAGYARQFGGRPYEIVAIRDARSLCEGYNRGLARARGDLVVFSHDDIEILGESLGDRLEAHLAQCDVVGVAGTARLAGMGWAEAGIRHARGMIALAVDGGYVVRLFGAHARLMQGVEALDGVFFAARREVSVRIGFDERTFDGWHGYDTDFTFRCHLAGHRVAVCLDVPLIHWSNGNVDRAWLRYAARFADKHRGSLKAVEGPWLDVEKRVRTPAEVLATFEDFDALRELTGRIAQQA